MESQTKTCQNCKKDFTIEPDDFAFYEKIKVPPPTFCPDCRLQRRMGWRNERSLYKRKCSAPGHNEEIISMYAPDSPYNIVDLKYWWSDEWDPLDYGQPYDFNKPFFQQFAELTQRVPLLSLSVVNSVESDYTNYVDGNKNCYLVFGSGWNENVNYGSKIMRNKDSQDLLGDGRCELTYECINCVECYKLLYSLNCKNCVNSFFLYNCRNCQNCIGCANLNNKSYCVFNEQFTREEYQKKFEEMRLNTVAGINIARFKFREVCLSVPNRYANIFNSVDCTGENIDSSKNSKYCFDIFEKMEDSKYMFGSLNSKDNYDGVGIFQNPLCYETSDANVGQNVRFSLTIYASHNIDYSWNCHSSSNLFGCVGIRSKNYCILNKQYTKEEYETLVPKIIEHMNSNPYVDKKERVYRYGEFFPIDVSPFAYNETTAQEYFNLSKDQIEQSAFRWRDTIDRNYVPTRKADDLPQSAGEITDDFSKEIIECLHKGECHHQCTKAFRFILPELQFYKKLDIPLPKLCPNCRHYERLRQRNPLKLWHRQCMCDKPNHGHDGKCPNEFETSYAPDRPETVYCEQCYQQEVV